MTYTQAFVASCSICKDNRTVIVAKFFHGHVCAHANVAEESHATIVCNLLEWCVIGHPPNINISTSVNVDMTDFTSGWSGATPKRTRPARQCVGDHGSHTVESVRNFCSHLTVASRCTSYIAFTERNGIFLKNIDRNLRVSVSQVFSRIKACRATSYNTNMYNGSAGIAYPMCLCIQPPQTKHICICLARIVQSFLNSVI